MFQTIQVSKEVALDKNLKVNIKERENNED